MKRIISATILLTVGVLMGPASSHAAVLVRDYELNGSFADTLGGPAINPDGGTLNATNYSFGQNQGLNVLNAAAPHDYSFNDYSIETTFSFSTLSGFRKILDFKDRTSDSGLYNLNTALNFFPVATATGSPGAFTADVPAHLVVTRDAVSSQFVGYVNGVQQISFPDSSGLAVFDSTGNIMRFFEDDSVTGQSEASAGVVDFIRIYKGALTATEVRALEQPVPEPATLLLAGVGISTLVVGAWRRRGRS
ncbi:MAG TPA: LamG-like jellyroll fold domain-containing protein [Gemmatimonadaceae bacterium]